MKTQRCLRLFIFSLFLAGAVFQFPKTSFAIALKESSCAVIVKFPDGKYSPKLVQDYSILQETKKKGSRVSGKPFNKNNKRNGKNNV